MKRNRFSLGGLGLGLWLAGAAFGALAGAHHVERGADDAGLHGGKRVREQQRVGVAAQRLADADGVGGDEAAAGDRRVAELTRNSFAFAFRSPGPLSRYEANVRRVCVTGSGQ